MVSHGKANTTMPALQFISLYTMLTLLNLLLFIMQMNNYKTTKEVAGLFLKNLQQPEFLSADRHPVQKFLAGNRNKR